MQNEGKKRVFGKKVKLSASVVSYQDLPDGVPIGEAKDEE